ncbi:hypothetical protein LCGC14_1180580 [marine sediment metagenome]|uniref:FCP1 homology domain-containing protein n=1 Tax=marine sediment metagenome TaxID=412755 RepID=A0A0F9P557_9ZZZZ
MEAPVYDKAKKTIAIDFDGVIHAYSKGWQEGVIYDEPVEGVIEALVKLSKDYKLVIYTTRVNTEYFPENDAQMLMIKNWLRRNLMDANIEVTDRKPPAIAYIDDRAIRFTNWPDMVKYFA